MMEEKFDITIAQARLRKIQNAGKKKHTHDELMTAFMDAAFEFSKCQTTEEKETRLEVIELMKEITVDHQSRQFAKTSFIILESISKKFFEEIDVSEAVKASITEISDTYNLKM